MPDFISTQPGSEVLVDGRRGLIERALGADKVLVNLGDKDFKTVAVADLRPLRAPSDSDNTGIPMPAYSEDALERARFRKEVIQPILDDPDNKSALIKLATEKYGISRSTIYRWLQHYGSSKRLTSLMRRRKGKGKKRLDARVEQIIKDVIENEYLGKQQVSMKFVAQEVAARCKIAKLKPPHRNTVYRRIKEVKAEEATRRRRGAKAARNLYDPIRGAFPEGNYPLECVQFDETPLDLHIMDEDTGASLDTLNLTIGIDTYSRMIVAYHLSFDAPSAYTAGAAIRRMMLPKDAILQRLGIEGEWPVWGVAQNIHMDNGRNFRSNSLARSCEQHGMTLEFRPPGYPNWGGIVERFFKTLNSEIHNLDGTKKSNPKEKGEYNSEKHATYTIEQIEKYIVTWIVKHYHLREHSNLGKSPLECWKEGINGTKGSPGIGIPDVPLDTKDLLIDFLPSEERVVDRRGIRWDGIQYYAPALDRWIGEQKGGKSIKHIVKRDPKDISKIYFFDPELQKYLDIPFSDISLPSVSLSEVRTARKLRASRGWKTKTEAELFEGIMELRDQRQNAKASAKQVKAKRRRETQKKFEAASRYANDEDILPVIPEAPPPPRAQFSFGGKAAPSKTNTRKNVDYGEWS